MNNFEIYEKVKEHAEKVKAFIRTSGYQHIMTSLYGSQNYGIETDTSDIDTCSFVAPNIYNLMSNAPLISKEFELKDGKCVVKDIRLAFNLLRKSNPNTIEWFLSDYQYYEPTYASVLNKFLNDGYCRRMIIHCDYQNMINAIIGTATGLHSRNMSSGKKYSHIIRLAHLASKYINSIETSHYFLLPKEDREIALLAKTTPSKYSFQENINAGIQEIKDIFQYFKYGTTFIQEEQLARYIVNEFQTKLFDVYLKENGYEKKN